MENVLGGQRHRFWTCFEGRDNRIYCWIGLRFEQKREAQDDPKVSGLNTWKERGVTGWGQLQDKQVWERSRVQCPIR